MFTKTFLAAGGCAVVLAGCGSGHAASSTTPSAGRSMSSAQVRATVQQLVRCIRQHGAPNYPDPVLDENGDWQPAPGAGKPPQSAMNACRSIADRLPSSEKHSPPTAADMARLRGLAKCIRRNGIPDWPDPNADGAFPLPPRLARGGKPMFRTQLQACRQYFPPKGKIAIQNPGAGNGG